MNDDIITILDEILLERELRKKEEERARKVVIQKIIIAAHNFQKLKEYILKHKDWSIHELEK